MSARRFSAVHETSLPPCGPESASHVPETFCYLCLRPDTAESRNLASAPLVVIGEPRFRMFTFLLWCILFVLCWPIALLALLLYPVVWLLLLPFRLVGIAVEGALRLVWAIVTLPFRVVNHVVRPTA